MSRKAVLEEIERRESMIKNLKEAIEEERLALTQFKDLDALNTSFMEDEADKLTRLYLESRHYTGKQPIVYTTNQVNTRPYFNGTNDDSGNPYYRLSLVRSGQSKGIAPIGTPPTITNGRWTRDRNYGPTEDIPRLAALDRLQAYPDYSGEPLPQGFPGPQGNESGPSSPLIPDPVWTPEDTAPGLLRPVLEDWKRNVEAIRDQTYTLNQVATQDYYQSVIDEIDLCLSLLPADAVFTRNTGDPDPTTWGRTPQPTGQLLDTLNELINQAETIFPNFVSNRKSNLQGEATFLENSHYTFVNMRIHQVNGSFTKLKTIEEQIDINLELLEDHKKVLNQLRIQLTRL